MLFDLLSLPKLFDNGKPSSLSVNYKDATVEAVALGGIKGSWAYPFREGSISIDSIKFASKESHPLFLFFTFDILHHAVLVVALMMCQLTLIFYR